MKPNYTQLGAAFGIVLMSAAECLDVYPRLPDPMATNFGGDGTAGGWSSKAVFVTSAALSMAFWFGMLLALPRLAARIQSARSLDVGSGLWVRDSTGWFLVASLGFSAVVMHLVFDANLRSGRLSNEFAWLLAVYLTYVAIWTVRLVRWVRAQRDSSG